MFLSKLFKRTRPQPLEKKRQTKNTRKQNASKTGVKPTRIGELGEYKINIQLDQFPKEWKHLHDLLIPNPRSKSGYSQIDHVVITTQGLFVIETKNYAGNIAGNKTDKQWTVNGKFKMYNPLFQNYGHIKAIQQLLGSYTSLRYFSMISFTRRCTFKVDPELRKITSDDLIVYDTELTEYTERKMNILRVQKIDPCLDDNDIKDIFTKLTKANLTDERIRKEHVSKAKSPSKMIAADKKDSNKCCICGQTVSEKVQQFCLTNQKRFKGKVYCFEHQNNR
jgi:hypothetical protein